MKNKYIFFSLIPFVLSAYFSDGFLHPDEHYQILELLNLKISSVWKPEIFNWDFGLQIRSWFQVFVYFILSKISLIKNPFALALLFRMFNGLLGFLSIYLLFKNEDDQETFHQQIMLVSWTWFIPFMFVRTSSESLSTSLFIIGAYFFLKGNSKRLLLSGIFWGMSFLCRFQMGIPILFANIWYLITKKDVKGFVLHSFAVLVMIGVGAVIDRWGYGNWVFTPYQYFIANIIKSRASEFGTEPVWFYLTQSLVKGGLPLAIMLLVGTYLYWEKKPMGFWTVVTFSFFLVHSLIPHKELRFLFFVYVLSAYFTSKMLRYGGRLNTIMWKIAMFTNFIFLSKTMFTPAHSTVELYKFINKQKIETYFTPLNSDGSYFKLTMPFYEGRRVGTRGVEIKTNEGALAGNFITTTYREYEVFKKLKSCENIFSNHSKWVLEKNYFKWRERSAILSVWNCKSKT